VTNWQQQYVALSQQNVSSTDLVQQLSSLIDENQRLKQVIEHLNTDIQASHVSMTTHDQYGTSSAVQSELSSQLLAVKNELNVMRIDRDRLKVKYVKIMTEFKTSRTEAKSVHSRYGDKIQAIEKQSEHEISVLNTQLAEVCST